MRIDGRATPAGTSRFRDRAVSERAIAFDHFREYPGALSLSSIGLGTYIGGADAATDLAVEQAASLCLESGRVNVLDTAINYRHQRAERSIGRALSRSMGRGPVARDEVFVSTKVGYLAPDGESGIAPQRWLEEQVIAPGHLAPADIVDGSHAMSPSYLVDQVGRSRANLGVATIDLLYLHNAPEAQLPTLGRERFFARLEEAFRVFEAMRQRGEIAAYGLATWDSLRVPPDHPSYLSIEQAARTARKVGGDGHGLRSVQFPFNVAMPEAVSFANQSVRGELLPLFEAARRLGIGCFTSVPLLQGQLARSGPRRGGLSPAQTAVQFARSAPGNIAALVGQKSPHHLAENLELATRPPWDGVAFAAALR